jgi:hypothetical protein
MSWSMLFTAMLEVAEDDANLNKKREERATEKKSDDAAKTALTMGGTLAIDRSIEVEKRGLGRKCSC